MSQENFALSNSSYETMMNVVDDSKKHDKVFTQEKNNLVTHNVEEGRNVFRISPGLQAGGVPYMPIRYSLMLVEVDEYADGEPTGHKKWMLKRCYIATQHGPRKDGKSLILKDPIEFYIETVIKMCRKKSTSEEEFEKMIAPIRGYRDSAGKFIWGLEPFTRIVCYAWDKDWKLGRLELYKTWFEQMKGINALENKNSKEPHDIFSDAKNGCPLVIDKTKTKAGKRTKTDYAITQLPLDKNSRESWDEYFEKHAINAERVEELKQVKTLESLYWQSYTLEHFGRIKKGLMHFDEQNGYGLFQMPLFMKSWEKLENHVREFVKEKEEEKQADQGQSTEQVAKTYEDLTNAEVITILQAYAESKYGAGTQLPKLSATELKIWYKIVQRGEDLPLANDNDPVDESDDLPF